MEDQDNTAYMVITITDEVSLTEWSRVIAHDGYTDSLLDFVLGYIAEFTTRTPGPASSASIDALRIVNKEEEDNAEADCPICLEKLFEEKEMMVKEMPCGHKYHAICLEKWLQMNSTCPFCRYKMPG
jgi:Ring finger domain